MGLTVIPSAVAGLLPTNGASAGAAGDALAGDFAALLSGELLSLQTDPSILANRAGKGERTELTAGDDGSGASGPDPSLLASLFGHFDSKAAASIATTTAPLPDGEELVSGNSAQRGPFTETGSELASQRRMAIGDQAAKVDQVLSDRKQLLTTAADKGASTASFGNQLAASLRSPAANIAGDNRTADTPPASGTPPAAVNANPPAQGLERALSAEARHTAVNAHLHSAAWPQQFGDKIVWLAKNEQQSAQLTINPPQLGPIQISLNLSGDQASIAFASPHAEVRQAIESAMPQLKEMLSSAGISLGQSNVGANLTQQSAENPFSDANGKRSADENAILPANDKAANAPGNPVLHRGRGLVDLFA